MTEVSQPDPEEPNEWEEADTAVSKPPVSEPPPAAADDEDDTEAGTWEVPTETGDDPRREPEPGTETTDGVPDEVENDEFEPPTLVE